MEQQNSNKSTDKSGLDLWADEFETKMHEYGF
jgi:hypothetical protein